MGEDEQDEKKEALNQIRWPCLKYHAGLHQNVFIC